MAQQTEPQASPEQPAAVGEQLSTLARVAEQLESASQQINAQGREQVRMFELILSINCSDPSALTPNFDKHCITAGHARSLYDVLCD